MRAGGRNVTDQDSSPGRWARWRDRWRQWRHDAEVRQARPTIVGPLGVHLLGLVLALAGLGLILLLVSLWPAVQRATAENAGDQVVKLFGAGNGFTISPDTTLLLLVVVVSALGSFVHAATSFATYVGNRRLMRSWVWWYLLRVIIGSALAVLFYFALRGSFMSATSATSSQAVNPYGIAALAGLVGLFSKQAIDKLREVFETAFHATGDEERKDKATNPQPHVSGVTPPSIPKGSSDTVLTIQGQGFIGMSSVELTRLGTEPQVTVPRTATYVSASEITVKLTAEDLAEAGEVEIKVVNPAPGGGTSNPIRLQVP